MRAMRWYFRIMLLCAGFLMALTVSAQAVPGGFPQEKIEKNTQAPAGVSPAKPGVQPPVVETRRCDCCCCRCSCCAEMSAGRAGSKDPRSKPRLTSPQGDAVPIERSAGEAGMYLEHASVLGLTDDQQDRLKDIAYASEKKMIDLKAALQRERLELRKLMNEDDLNPAAIRKQLEAVARAKTEVTFEKISAMVAAREILSKEQRGLFEEKCRRGEKGYSPWHGRP